MIDYVTCKVADGKIAKRCQNAALDEILVSIPIHSQLPQPKFRRYRVPICVEHMESLLTDLEENVYFTLSETLVRPFTDQLN